MKVLVINGSPKKKGGASAFFSKIISFFLFPARITYKALGTSSNYENIFACIKDMDAVLLSVPLYVDSIPSHFLHFLKELETFCAEKKCRFKLYVISNSGFLGKRQNQPHLEQYKCWCERAGITWGGGLGIEGGVMLHVIFYFIFLYGIIRFAVSIIFNAVYGNPLIDKASIFTLIQNMGIWLFFNIGLFACGIIFALAIKFKKKINFLHARAMLPSFIFFIVADIFMTLTAVLHGKIFSLNKKGDYTSLLK